MQIQEKKETRKGTNLNMFRPDIRRITGRHFVNDVKKISFSTLCMCWPLLVLFRRRRSPFRRWGQETPRRSHVDSLVIPPH